ncbi:tRNA pseudouridine(55) synthase TruB [Streptomyces buecherae]
MSIRHKALLRFTGRRTRFRGVGCCRMAGRLSARRVVALQ